MSKLRWPLEGNPVKIMAAICLTLASFSGSAQNERWFTFEVSVFSNELASDRGQELPIAKADATLKGGPTKSLIQFFDLLNLAQWPAGASGDNQASANSAVPRTPVLRPLAEGEKSYQFTDLARDPFITLSSSASDFQQTNRALERSPVALLLRREKTRHRRRRRHPRVSAYDAREKHADRCPPSPPPRGAPPCSRRSRRTTSTCLTRSTSSSPR